MIAGALRRHPLSREWTYLSHGQALTEPDRLLRATSVINLAFDSRLKTGPYDEAFDIDLQLARRLAGRPVPYVMASTRMVYGAANGDPRLSEDMDARPTTRYGASKLETEKRLRAILGDQLTILRLSNIFDQSEAEGQRRSFFGLAMRTLEDENRIVFDMSPFVERDFLPAIVVAERLSAIAGRPVPGVFNLGAGFGVPTGRIAQWLIEGHGEGELVVVDLREFDAFWLDIAKAASTWQFPPFTERELRSHCQSAGAALRKVSAREDIMRA
jgi:dTDP-4-dehydrorhamnose reductase/UDP-glucose 4-epimerase